MESIKLSESSQWKLKVMTEKAPYKKSISVVERIVQKKTKTST